MTSSSSMRIASARTCQLPLSLMVRIPQPWALDSMANVPYMVNITHSHIRGAMSRRLAEDLPVLGGNWLIKLQFFHQVNHRFLKPEPAFIGRDVNQLEMPALLFLLLSPHSELSLNATTESPRMERI